METTQMISVAISIGFAAFLGALNSLLSYFLDYCFYEGSIFGFWLPTLAKANLAFFRPAQYQSVKSAKKNPEYDNMLCQMAQDMFFYKVLGGCIICSNIWLGAVTFTVIWACFGFSYFLIFPYLLFSSFVLRKIIG